MLHHYCRHIWIEALVLGVMCGTLGGFIIGFVSTALVDITLTPLVGILLHATGNPFLALPIYFVLVIMLLGITGILSGLLAGTPGDVLAQRLLAWSPSARARWRMLWVIAGSMMAVVSQWYRATGAATPYQISDVRPLLFGAGSGILAWLCARDPHADRHSTANAEAASRAGR